MARMLLVEDSDDVREILKTTLVDCGHQVTDTECCHQARFFMARQMFDLLIADIGLPDCDGATLAEEADAVSMPHLLMTGAVDTALRLEGAGKTCLKKPFSLSTFVKIVDACLAPGLPNDQDLQGV